MRIITCAGIAQPAHPDAGARPIGTSAPKCSDGGKRLFLDSAFGAHATSHAQAWATGRAAEARTHSKQVSIGLAALSTAPRLHPDLDRRPAGVTGSWVSVAVRSETGDGVAGLIRAVGDAFTAAETAILIANTEPLPQWLPIARPAPRRWSLVTGAGDPRCASTQTAAQPWATSLGTTAGLDLPGARS